MTHATSTLTPALLAAATGCTLSAADRFAIWIERACWHYGILGPQRMGAFLGQIGHESAGLQRTEESLSYSTAERIRAVWPKRFPTPDAATPFVRQPQRLANHVYANRMGNGGPETNDGWRYRGRGLIQITGRAEYAAAAAALGVDLIARPELAAEPEWAAMTAGLYWHRAKLNALADVENHLGITRRINGGLHGLADRIDRTLRATRMLKTQEA